MTSSFEKLIYHYIQLGLWFLILAGVSESRAVALEESSPSSSISALISKEPMVASDFIDAHVSQLQVSDEHASIEFDGCGDKLSEESNDYPCVKIQELLTKNPRKAEQFLAGLLKRKPRKDDVNRFEKPASSDQFLSSLKSQPVTTNQKSTKEKSIAPTEPSFLPDVLDRQLAEDDSLLEDSISSRSRSRSRSLRVQVSDKGITLDRSAFKFASKGDELEVSFEYASGFNEKDPANRLSVFVRDGSIVRWQPKNKSIIAKSKGDTELYFVVNGSMTIVPVTVGGDTENINSSKDGLYAALTIPDSLTNTDSLIADSSDKSRTYASRSEKEVTTSSSIKDSLKYLEKPMATKKGFFVDKKEFASHSLVLQLMDERSSREKNLIYPIKDLTVKVIGNRRKIKSDARGVVVIDELPRDGHLLVEITDPNGFYRRSVVEVDISESSLKKPILIKVLTERMFDLYSTVYETVQRSNLGSFCADIEADSLESRKGLTASLNVSADGPFFFNKFGPYEHQNSTGTDGRFCFFNVEPGLVEVTISKRGEDGAISSFAIPVIEGSHLEDRFDIQQSTKIDAKIALLPPAKIQIYGNQTEANKLFPVDYADVLAVGENEPLDYKMDGELSLVSEVPLSYKNRLYTLVDGAEYETTLLSLKNSDNNQVIPLLPRGFVEDIYNELSMGNDITPIAFDQGMGSLVVHYGAMKQMENEDVTIRVINSHGFEVDGGWYYGAEGSEVTKAIYFNMQPGIYTVIVESSDGDWLDVQTIPLDYWVTSFVQLGSKWGHSGYSGLAH